jgi:hypothetical protein
MIVIRIKGRLGDQLLRYAAARALAKHLHTDVGVDLWWVTKKPDKYKYYLKDLGLPAKELYGCGFSDDDDRGSRSYSKSLFHKHDNIILKGLWYHHKYFSNVIDDMRKEVKPVDVPKDFVGMHVRRGDFVDLKNRVECDTNYIKRAIEIFPSEKYLITTDDYKWCSENLKGIAPTVHTFSTNPVDDFLRLRSCSKLIISSSSFSWFAALLADCPVVAPDKWFRNKKNINTPKEWIRI